MNLKTLTLSALIGLGVFLGGCASDPGSQAELDLAPEASSAEPLDDGNPPPGTLDPGSGQPSEPNKVGLPGNKSGK